MYVEFTITTILDKNVVTPRPQINVVLRFHVATLNSGGGGWCYNNCCPRLYPAWRAREKLEMEAQEIRFGFKRARDCPKILGCAIQLVMRSVEHVLYNRHT